MINPGKPWNCFGVEQRVRCQFLSTLWHEAHESAWQRVADRTAMKMPGFPEWRSVLKPFLAGLCTQRLSDTENCWWKMRRRKSQRIVLCSAVMQDRWAAEAWSKALLDESSCPKVLQGPWHAVAFQEKSCGGNGWITMGHYRGHY